MAEFGRPLVSFTFGEVAVYSIAPISRVYEPPRIISPMPQTQSHFSSAPFGLDDAALDGEKYRTAAQDRHSKIRICSSVSSKLAPGGWREMKKTDHFVQFYERDEHLLDSLAEYVADGLWQGERVIVIATGEHRAALDERLRANGLDVASAIITRQYLAADAEQTLAGFMVDGKPDAIRFHDTVGPILQSAARGNRAVRAFGEMVALLWARGDRSAALTVEQLWDQVAATTSFSLFCAYPAECFADDAEMGGLRQVCHAHSRVIPAYC
jgi:hypothetical protein